MGLWLHLSYQGYATLYPNHLGLSADAIFIFIGGLSIVIALFGCCGSFFESRCCLIIVSCWLEVNWWQTFVKQNISLDVISLKWVFFLSFQYFSLIIVLFLSEFIVGALVFIFRTGISRAVTMDIKDGIIKHYNSTDRGGMISPSVSSIWDRVQMQLQCCGVNSYEDWYYIENWPREKWVPKSCCRTRHSMSLGTYTDLYEGSGGYEDDDCRKYVHSNWYSIHTEFSHCHFHFHSFTGNKNQIFSGVKVARKHFKIQSFKTYMLSA